MMVQSCRYLGITIESASRFKCNISEAKKIVLPLLFLGRVGRIAIENVTVKLLMKKCLPTLLYAFEVCLFNKSDIRALDCVIDSTLEKIVDANSNDIILECRLMFDLNSIGDINSYEKAT